MAHNPSSMDKPSIAVIGAGRVGSSLAAALHTTGYPITAVWSRTEAHARELAARVSAPVVSLESAPRAAALTLIAVSDDSIGELAARLAAGGAWENGRMVIHCSGTLPAAALAPAAARGALVGALHPLVAIAERDQALPRGITFAVEAAEPLRGLLRRMAHDLGGRPFNLDPEQRPLYHAAAVLASNYTVVLAALAAELLQHAGVGGGVALEALLPLLRSAVANLETAGLPHALTGPLVRGDAGTVMRHLAELDHAAPAIAAVYRELGKAALPLVEARDVLDRDTLGRLADVLASVPLADAIGTAAEQSSTGQPDYNPRIYATLEE